MIQEVLENVEEKTDKKLQDRGLTFSVEKDYVDHSQPILAEIQETGNEIPYSSDHEPKIL